MINISWETIELANPSSPPTVLDFDVRFASLIDDLEREVSDIRVDLGAREFVIDETLSVEDIDKVN